MAKVYLVHGFNVKDAQEASLAFLGPVLKAAGHDVVIVDYGWTQRLRIRLCNKGFSRMLRSMAEPDSIVIGHSNGCAIIHEACEMGATFKKVILFNPALDRDMIFAQQIKDITIFYSKDDAATKWAKWIPFSSWGSMGAEGYVGIPDSRVTNMDEESITKKEMGHSDFSKYPNLFGEIIINLCR